MTDGESQGSTSSSHEDQRLLVTLTKGDLARLVETAVEAAMEGASGEVQPLLDQVQLARILGVSTRTIYSLRQRGLPVYMLGESPRFDIAEVRAWLRNRET